jgi:glycosyltransferase involved in cell wall biosynthesis
MKVAIVHDYIKEYGGAERVVETLHDMFPKAPIYTTVSAPQFLGPHKDRVKTWDIRTSWLQKIPFTYKFIGWYRLIAPFVFSQMDLSEYDVVITSCAGTYTSPNDVKIGEKTKLIAYYHTPPRYLYGYATAGRWEQPGWRQIVKVVGEIPMHILRILDFKSAQKPDVIVANSEEVKKRIEKFYRRDAVVINPPVELQNSKPETRNSKQEDYYLTGGRLARAKHNEIPLLACTFLGRKLKVFGKDFSGYLDELIALAEKERLDSKKTVDIEFVGEVTDTERIKLMKGAKAFLYASMDEDFGIIPVESMGCGTPVIAYKSGGVKETVLDGKTGVFYDKLTPESMGEAIKKFETLRQAQGKKMEAECVSQAKKFSEEVFKNKVKALVKS